MLTLFTVPKPFEGEIAVLQRNAIRSWRELGEEVQVLLLGEEAGIAEAARDLGVTYIPVSDRTPGGAPLLSRVFARARQEARHPILGYVNADIILLDDFRFGVQRVARSMDRFLIVGRRWDLGGSGVMRFGPRWEEEVRERVRREARLHPPTGSDYFVFPSVLFGEIPPFALGRSGWDNWMIFRARQMRIPVVDASGAITAVHQDHDYSHLPGGNPHHRHPESLRNMELAGGRETVFRLRDADWKLGAGDPMRKGWKDWEWPEKIEADLTLLFGPGRAARAVRLLFHPVATLRYFLGRPNPSARSPRPTRADPGER